MFDGFVVNDLPKDQHYSELKAQVHQGKKPKEEVAKALKEEENILPMPELMMH